MKRFLGMSKEKSKKNIGIVFGIVQLLFIVLFLNSKFEIRFSPTYYQGSLQWEIAGDNKVGSVCEVKAGELLKTKAVKLFFQGDTWNTVYLKNPSISIHKWGITVYSQEISEDTSMKSQNVDFAQGEIWLRGAGSRIIVDVYRKALWFRLACIAFLFWLLEIGVFWLIVKKRELLNDIHKKCIAKLTEYKREGIWWIMPLSIMYFIISEQIVKINYKTQSGYILVSAIFLLLVLKAVICKKETGFYIAENIEGMNGRKVLYLLGGIVVFVLYAYHLTIDELHGDEAYHYLAAKGFLKTGHFVQWDYVNNIPYTAYTRAWPYTLCIAIAFFIFGESLLTARILSVLFGVLFWIILFKCFQKFIRDERIAFFISLIVSGNPVLIEIFRTIRMYAMSMPLALLLIVCVYKMLMSAEEVPSDAKTLKILYPYSIKYTVLTLGLVMLNYLVMPNVLLIAGGVLLWILYQGIIERKKKYQSSVVLIIIGGAFAIVLFVFRQNLPQKIQKLVERVRYHISWFKHIQVEYIWEHLKYPVGYICAVVAMILMVVYVFKLKDKKEKNLWLLLGFIELTTASFFTLITERGFAIRYIFYLVPISSVIVLYGMYLIFKEKKKLGKQVYVAIVLFSAVSALVANFNAIYQGENDYAKFSEAYEKISKVVGTSSINLCTSHYRSNYLAPYFKEVNYLEYTQTKYLEQSEDGSYVKPDIEQLIDYSKEYQTGVLSIEKKKYDYTTEPLRQVAEKYMNKVTGTGVDDTNVESYLYHMYHSQNTSGEWKVGQEIVYRKGIITYDIDEERSKMYIKVDTQKLPEDSVMLCINTWCGNNEKMIYQSYQLVLPEDEQEEAIYCVDWNMGKKEEFYIAPPAGVYTKEQQVKEIEL